MTMSANRELLRLRYEPGQMVRSSDFREKHRVEGELRAWHNRAMHNAYGVAKGVLDDLKVEPLENDAGVKVASGLAFDCYGRELQLRRPTAIDFPDFAEPSFLVLSYGQSSDRSQGNGTLCFNSCAEAPSTATLSWILTRDFSVIDGVPLGETEFTGGRARLKPKFHTLQARALRRPRIANGTTIPGATKWQQWDPHEDFFDGLIGHMQVRIDTSSAGFTRVPAYFAWLEGKLNDTEIPLLTFHFDHLDEVTPTGFVFRVALIFAVEEADDLPDQHFFNEKAYVSWLAIEEDDD